MAVAYMLKMLLKRVSLQSYHQSLDVKVKNSQPFADLRAENYRSMKLTVQIS